MKYRRLARTCLSGHGSKACMLGSVCRGRKGPPNSTKDITKGIFTRIYTHKLPFNPLYTTIRYYTQLHATSILHVRRTCYTTSNMQNAKCNRHNTQHTKRNTHHASRITQHKTRHTTHDTRHTTHDTRHTTNLQYCNSKSEECEMGSPT
jgi:hypothetical protein